NTSGGQSSFKVKFDVSSVADGQLLLQFSIGTSGWRLDNTTANQEWTDNGFNANYYANIILDTLNQQAITSYVDAASYWNTQSSIKGALKLKDSVTATYASKTSYTVTIKATDAAGLNSTNNVTVNVLEKYSASIAAKPGTVVTTLPADGYNANVTGTFTYSIVGGVDSDLFEVNSTTGALTFKTAKTIDNPVDSSMDNIYDVEILMQSDTGASQIAKVGVTVEHDGVAPTFSNLSLSYAVDADDSKTTITVQGKIKDDASTVNSSYVQLKDSFTGKTMYMGISSDSISADGSFSTSRVMS
ncbi:uncharacterized protein METZ01_LOCUS375371, partial [marine metagenome]